MINSLWGLCGRRKWTEGGPGGKRGNLREGEEVVKSSELQHSASLCYVQLKLHIVMILLGKIPEPGTK